MKPVDRVGGRVAYRESGVGPPVLFLHGLGGSRYAWEPQLESLGATHRCLAWDMPGYGDSEPLSAPLTQPALPAASLHYPIGLDIGGETPHEIALAILAQIRAVFAGRSGGMLARRAGSIHD